MILYARTFFHTTLYVFGFPFSCPVFSTHGTSARLSVVAPLPNQFTHWRKLRSSAERRVDCREGLGRHAARNDALNAVPPAEESIHILPSPVPVEIAAVAGVVPSHRRAAGDRGCMTIPLPTFPYGTYILWLPLLIR